MYCLIIWHNYLLCIIAFNLFTNSTFNLFTNSTASSFSHVYKPIRKLFNKPFNPVTKQSSTVHFRMQQPLQELFSGTSHNLGLCQVENACSQLGLVARTLVVVRPQNNISNPLNQWQQPVCHAVFFAFRVHISCTRLLCCEFPADSWTLVFQEVPCGEAAQIFKIQS